MFSNLICANVHYVARGAFHPLWNVCGSETTKIQKCLHKLSNNHIDVVILCCNWDSDPPCIVKRDKRFFALNHVTLSPWVDSRTYSSTSCLSLPTREQDRCCLPPAGAAQRSIGLNRHVAASLLRTNSVEMLDVSWKTTSSSPWLPTRCTHWIITFSAGRTTVSKRNAIKKRIKSTQWVQDFKQLTNKHRRFLSWHDNFCS